MQLFSLLMVLVIILVLLAGIMPAGGNDAINSELILFYKNCINNIAAKSGKYQILINSDSEYIRSYASAMVKKSAFLQQNRKKLIHEMIMQDIGRHPRSIDLFLNQEFFKAMKTARRRKSSEFVN